MFFIDTLPGELNGSLHQVLYRVESDVLVS